MSDKANIAAAVLAHVDAGKTTLSEALLYESGMIRRAGRVDNKDAFLDTFALEKERGITIFSKQAVLKLPEETVTLLDTPGMWIFRRRWSGRFRYWITRFLSSAGRTVCRRIRGRCLGFWRSMRCRCFCS